MIPITVQYTFLVKHAPFKRSWIIYPQWAFQKGNDFSNINKEILSKTESLDISGSVFKKLLKIGFKKVNENVYSYGLVLRKSLF
jgi:hypothetical protein